MSLNQNFEELSNIPSLSETWSVTITIILVGFGVAIHPHNGTGCKGHEAKMNTRILEEKTIHFYIQSTIKIAINAKKKRDRKTSGQNSFENLSPLFKNVFPQDPLLRRIEGAHLIPPGSILPPRCRIHSNWNPNQIETLFFPAFHLCLLFCSVQ